MNFEDNFYVIICSHVLEHIEDGRKAMRELFRVLKPGGEAILQAPISKYSKKTFEDFSIVFSREREKYFGQRDHVKIYGKNYKNRLKNVGFKLGLYDINKFLSTQDIRKFGLNKEDVLYAIQKP